MQKELILKNHQIVKSIYLLLQFIKFKEKAVKLQAEGNNFLRKVQGYNPATEKTEQDSKVKDLEDLENRTDLNLRTKIGLLTQLCCKQCLIKHLALISNMKMTSKEQKKHYSLKRID